MAFDGIVTKSVIKELQNLIVDARKQMIFDLAQNGKTVKELTIEEIQKLNLNEMIKYLFQFRIRYNY